MVRKYNGFMKKAGTPTTKTVEILRASSSLFGWSLTHPADVVKDVRGYGMRVMRGVKGQVLNWV